MSRHRAPTRVRTYRCEHAAVFRDAQGVENRIPGAVATVQGSEEAVRWALERIRVIAEQYMETQAQVDEYVSDLRAAYPAPPEVVLAECGWLDLEMTDTDGAVHEITVRLPVDVPAPVRLPRHRAIA